MTKILITNDDGIDADGMRRLVEAAKAFGEVLVVAPDGQRSASAHSIAIRHPLDVFEYAYPVPGVTAYTCSGMPADCVRVGVRYILKDKPDLVLAGINYGYNSATDIQYSGTCGAAFEGAFQGVHSIAVSENASDCHEVTDHYLHEVLDELIHTPLSYGMIHNVNFPGCPLSECKGILRDRTVSRSMFYDDKYKKLKKLEKSGYQIIVDGQFNNKAEEGTDMHALVNNYVSIGRVNNVGVM